MQLKRISKNQKKILVNNTQFEVQKEREKRKKNRRAFETIGTWFKAVVGVWGKGEDPVFEDLIVEIFTS